MLEQLAVQVAKSLRNAEGGLALVAGRQHHAEIVVTHVRREIVADDAFGTRTGAGVDDGRSQHLDQRERITAIGTVDVHLHRDDVQLDRVTIRAGVVPVRQIVEAMRSTTAASKVAS